MNKINDIKFIDLFAGIGGMRIAFERAGCACVFSSEWDKYCQETYENFFGERPHGDITLESVKKKIPRFDILVGGFPCQPFSSIGKRQGFLHQTQGTLFHDVVKILKRKKPAAFLLENVKGLRTHDNRNTYATIRSSLDKIGYWVNDAVLNAANYGVPQKRERIYLVGFRKDLVPASTEQDAWQKIGFSFTDIPKEKPVFINPYLEKNVEDRPITKHLQEVYIYKSNDGRPQILEHDKKDVANTLVASYHKIQHLTGIFVKGGSTGLRLLTENECRSIMGFPRIGEKDNIRTYCKVPVSRTQMYRQFGNSVAVPVIEKIAGQMVGCLQKLL